MRSNWSFDVGILPAGGSVLARSRDRVCLKTKVPFHTPNLHTHDQAWKPQSPNDNFETFANNAGRPICVSSAVVEISCPWRLSFLLGEEKP